VLLGPLLVQLIGPLDLLGGQVRVVQDQPGPERILGQRRQRVGRLGVRRRLGVGLGQFGALLDHDQLLRLFRRQPALQQAHSHDTAYWR
jgi:hypothetical protein